jgi:hypothetical protein
VDKSVRRKLLTPIESALALANNHARLGITVHRAELSTSILCDDGGPSTSSPTPATMRNPPDRDHRDR